MVSVRTLEWPDYVVLAVFLGTSLGIGVYHSLTGGRQRTTSEFIMANRRLSVLPTTISLLVSFQSATLIIGLTAEMYQYGIHFLMWAPVGLSITVLLCERVVVPWLYPLQLVSINDVSRRLSIVDFHFVFISVSQLSPCLFVCPLVYEQKLQDNSMKL